MSTAAPCVEATEFAKLVKVARDHTSKTPEFFRRPSHPNSKDKSGEVCFLRRWNSHTPFVVGSYGGGYFLRWSNKGTVIDPGPAFIQAFSRFTDYSLADIHRIVVTHDHSDHCVELGVMLSLLREFNKQRKKGGLGPHSWNVIVSAGAYAQHESVLNNSSMVKYFKVRRAMAGDKIGNHPLCNKYRL